MSEVSEVNLSERSFPRMLGDIGFITVLHGGRGLAMVVSHATMSCLITSVTARSGKGAMLSGSIRHYCINVTHEHKDSVLHDTPCLHQATEMTLVMGERAAAVNLWKSLGLAEDILSRLSLSADPDPAVNSSFRLGTAAQVRERYIYN